MIGGGSMYFVENVMFMDLVLSAFIFIRFLEDQVSACSAPCCVGKTTLLKGQICGAKVTPSNRRYW